MDSPVEPKRVVGRYALFAEIASGGMATVHLGRLTGAVGFSRTVAVKRLHQHFAKDPEFVSMFLDEARLAARIRHPNVVPTLDVVTTKGEIFLVMEYVHGETLSRLIRAAVQRGVKIPPRIVVTIMTGVLHGLHAAHQAKSEQGQPLGIVHRDVSPQNILVGADGVARVLDFGIAKAAGRLQTTRVGQLKGKLPYMAPEQVLAGSVSPQTDVYSAAVVIWEALAGRRLFPGNVETHILKQVLHDSVDPPSKWVPDLPPILDEIALRGLRHNPAERFASAREMAIELERSVPLASASEVGEWVENAATKDLALRAELVSAIECYTPRSAPQSDSIAPPDFIASPELIAPPKPQSGPPTATMHFAAQSRDLTATRVSTEEPPKVSSHNSDFPTQSAAQTVEQVPVQASRAKGILGTVLILVSLGLVSILLVSRLYDRGALPAPVAASNAEGSPQQAEPLPSTLTQTTEPMPAPVQTAAESVPALSELPVAPETQVTEEPVKAKVPSSKPAPRVKVRETQRKAAPAATEAKPKAAETSCSPPFTIDAMGVRHIKPECL